MERLGVVLAVLAVFAAAVVAVRPQRPASACTLGQFSVSQLPDASRTADIVAIGAFGELHGAVIEFKVESYFKAPASKAETLLVNNLAQTTTPACEPIATHLLVHESGERALILMNRDDNGVGANWIPTLKGTIAIRDDAVESFESGGGPGSPRKVPLSEVRSILDSALGESSTPRPGLVEVQVQPVGNLRCLYGPYTIRWLAENAPVIAVGTVESADAQSATIRVSTGFAGVNAGEALRIDNRYRDAGHAINTCEEATAPGPKYNVGDNLLLFLSKEGSRDLQGLRPAGVDGIGVFQTSAIYEWNGRLYSLSEAVREIYALTADRPATGIEANDTPIAVVERRTGQTPLWVLALIAGLCGAAAGAAVVGLTLASLRR